MRSVPCTAAAVLLGGLVLSGCAATEEPEAGRVATAFEDDSGDPAQRCDLLTPEARETLERSGTPCGEQLAGLPLGGGRVESVEVWGGDAQVRLAGDTVFLSRTSSGWRVSAAACTRSPEGPYDCEVEGS
jgi:hypothetical protein